MRDKIARMTWDECEPDVPEERAHRILTYIREEIEKVENPIDTVVMYGGNAQFSYEHLVQKQYDAVEGFRQKILSLLGGNALEIDEKQELADLRHNASDDTIG